jgi:phage tail tape-measure protein
VLIVIKSNERFVYLLGNIIKLKGALTMRRKGEAIGSSVGVFGGAILGAKLGGGVGLVAGPLGGIAGTIPGLIIGGVVFGLLGNKAGSEIDRHHENKKRENSMSREELKNQIDALMQKYQDEEIDGTTYHQKMMELTTLYQEEHQTEEK